MEVTGTANSAASEPSTPRTTSSFGMWRGMRIAASTTSRAALSLVPKTPLRRGSAESHRARRSMRSAGSSFRLPSNMRHSMPASAHSASNAESRAKFHSGRPGLGTAARQGGMPAESSRKAMRATAALSHTTAGAPSRWEGSCGSRYTTGVLPNRERGRNSSHEARSTMQPTGRCRARSGRTRAARASGDGTATVSQPCVRAKRRMPASLRPLPSCSGWKSRKRTVSRFTTGIPSDPPATNPVGAPPCAGGGPRGRGGRSRGLRASRAGAGRGAVRTRRRAR